MSWNRPSPSEAAPVRHTLEAGEVYDAAAAQNTGEIKVVQMYFGPLNGGAPRWR